ncbi:DNA polymerase/3'-5' exonuclease PolX [Mariniblastus sp.]|nr:DNA polymerase/3'-5' exonuclease PolX [Mariniblastus sp.]MDA7901709.1 DNA polymerase/3'-5' exonuclease PolX [bacterium]MDA7902899.1 DNA polymerase/3'-5' exonuclease PolX [Mariniblastus sp.]MDA7925272.1 DNA polymerase/3'-5' exonuclease PolX [Mariniblastus sp.]MDB4555429.1 DNA polymerase/3'-5' exonuclease PolX [bacterium]
MNNDKISKHLSQLADLLEFTGANSFRLRAYRNGSRIIKELPDSIASMIEAEQDLTKLDGIGKGVSEKCHELVNTGGLKQLDEILETVPKTVLDLLNVPKLGPKKCAALFNELGIQSLDQLKAACEAQQVRLLSGFGAKTEEAILQGISIAVLANERILWAHADKIAKDLEIHMSSCSAIRQIEFAGSYRRGKETVGDLDLLVDSDDSETVMDHFGKYEEITSVIVRGETKMSVRLENEFQVDLRVVPQESFGAALQYFTGSKDHNVLVRGRAKQMGLKVNEWGVFEVKDSDERWIAGQTELDVYESLNLPYFPPEIREARRELDWADKSELPQLIELTDIQGDLHMHTTATDGKATIEEMADAARVLGLSYIAITDHSQRVSMANGLNSERLLDQWKKIDEINANTEDEFVILKGIECDILEAGGMDLPDEVLAQGDFIIASVHYGQNQPRQQITDRIIGALENPHVSMIAHPTGRLLNKREAYEVDIDAVFQAAKANHKMVELNANPIRLDLNDIHLLAAKAHGIPVVINTDAHRTLGLSNMRYGIKQARRGCLSAADVANTLSLVEFLKMLGR